MRPRLRRAAVITSLILLIVLLLPIASIATTSWARRLQASRLLRSATKLHPGISTEAETKEILKPYGRDFFQGEETEYNKPTAKFDVYTIDNYSSWVVAVAPHLPESWNRHLWVLPWTTFSVLPRYQEGILADLELREMQEHRNDIHPYMASVRILTKRFEKDDVRLPDEFNGYAANPYTQVYVDKNDKPLGPAWIIREYITLDERASPRQERQSWNFQLSCFTSLTGCHDARKLLPLDVSPQS